MQSYNDDKLLKTLTGEMEDLKKALTSDPDLKDATHHVIGSLPELNSIVKINGLKFKVIHCDNLGRVNLKILEP